MFKRSAGSTSLLIQREQGLVKAFFCFYIILKNTWCFDIIDDSQTSAWGCLFAHLSRQDLMFVYDFVLILSLIFSLGSNTMHVCSADDICRRRGILSNSFGETVARERIHSTSHCADSSWGKYKPSQTSWSRSSWKAGAVWSKQFGTWQFQWRSTWRQILVIISTYVFTLYSWLCSLWSLNAWYYLNKSCKYTTILLSTTVAAFDLLDSFTSCCKKRQLLLYHMFIQTWVMQSCALQSSSFSQRLMFNNGGTQ